MTQQQPVQYDIHPRMRQNVRAFLYTMDSIFEVMTPEQQSWFHRELCNHLEGIAHRLWDDASEPPPEGDCL